MYRAACIVSLGVALLSGARPDSKAGLPPNVQEVTGDVHQYAEALPECSPDGHWLAFEYNRMSDPDLPYVGIMRLGRGHRSWHALLKPQLGGHMFVGDFSWSPDSHWLAVITSYPKGGKSSWSEPGVQIVKVNVYTHEAVRLTDFPVNTPLGPTTAWLRSGLIVFPGPDDDIYAVPDRGGRPRKLVSAPKEKCGGVTNTLAASPDQRQIAFVKDSNNENQVAECNALWIASVETGDLKRVPIDGLHPVSPYWLDDDTILFSGEEKGEPTGIYSVSLSKGKVTRLLKGLYETPFVCESGKTLYFSWGPKLRTKMPAGYDLPGPNDNYGFHIWKVPLRDVLR
jgi:hypothetical protein